MTLPRLKEMLYWINEREAMRVRKEAGEKWPFSKDPIMAANRFTNVMREDDKVTKWLAENWRTPHSKHENLPTAMVLARMVNYIPSLQAIGYPLTWQPISILAALKARAATGAKVWSSAYMITTCGKRMGKEEYVVYWVCDNAMPLNEKIMAASTLQEAYNLLRKVDGLGSFLAAQVIADLKNTAGTSLSQAPDWHSWSAPGPGSLKGLSAFWGITVTPSNYEFCITEAWATLKPELPAELQNLGMQDLQNCFCEFSKYARIKDGTGRARNGYR